MLHKKEIINIIKVLTHNEVTVTIYTIQKRPMFFNIDGQIFPTVYLLWKCNDIVYNFTTHAHVMSNISGGADLMLPGVLTPPHNSGLPKYGNVLENDVVAVNLNNNKASIAVGVAAENSTAMLQGIERGKCVKIYHFYGDKLCTLEGLKILPLPNLEPPD